VRDSLLGFVAVTAAVSLLYRLRGVAFIERNLAVIAAVLFLYLPALLLWRGGRDLEQYGLRAAPLRRGLLAFGLAGLLVLPAFGLGYWAYVAHYCLPIADTLAKLLGAAAMWHCPPRTLAALRWPPDLLMAALSQLLVVALPEEFFFRGFVQGRLGEALSPVRALVLTAVLFALGHYLVTFDPAALAVFFPGLLFGLLRQLTGSVLAGTLFHATCNLFMETLRRSLG
jgi:membrane protease YdiL (CAAX protease family)